MSLTCRIEVEGGSHKLPDPFAFVTCPRIGEMIALPTRNRPGYMVRFVVHAVIHTPESPELRTPGSTTLYVRPATQSPGQGEDHRHSA